MEVRKYFERITNYLFGSGKGPTIVPVVPQESYERTGRWEVTVTATWPDGRTERDKLHLCPPNMTDREQEEYRGLQDLRDLINKI